MRWDAGMQQCLEGADGQGGGTACMRRKAGKDCVLAHNARSLSPPFARSPCAIHALTASSSLITPCLCSAHLAWFGLVQLGWYLQPPAKSFRDYCRVPLRCQA